MAENETIGRCTCPVCGAEHQDVKTSKNNLMYVYCENHCRIWFNGRHRRHIAGLKAGISQQVDKVFIKSIKSKEQKQNDTRRIEQPTATGQHTGIDTGRRTTGEFGGLSAGAGAGEQPRKSWLARAWSDDDTDDE